MTTIEVEVPELTSSLVDPPPVDDGKPPERHGRLVGVDIARGLALLGMFTVHVFIVGEDFEKPGSTAQWFLDAPSGRASVLFFMLSGLSLSVISAKGSRSAEPATLRRRGAVLLLGGLVLSAGPWPASILEHYGVMFLLAPVFLVRSDRALLALAALGMIGGPIALTASTPVSEWIGGLDPGAAVWVVSTFWSLLVTGTYPLIVWFGFFALGVRLGRLDLRSTKVALGLVVLGSFAVLASVSATRALGVEAAPDPSFNESPIEESKNEDFDDTTIFESEADFKKWMDENGDSVKKFSGADIPDRAWSDLGSTQPHSGQIGWTLQASAIAIAILGLALAAPRLVQRLLWPLAALGSISLTAYLFHTVLVTDVWQQAIGANDFDAPPALSVNEQLLLLLGLQAVMVVLAMTIVRYMTTGPFERGLKALTQR